MALQPIVKPCPPKYNQQYTQNSMLSQIPLLFISIHVFTYTKCTFCCVEHHSCHGMSWQKQALYMMKLLIWKCRYLYKGVSKSSRTLLVKRSSLTLDVKFLHHLQSTPLLHKYSGSSFSAMLGSIPGSAFLELCQVPTAIPLESLQWCWNFDHSSEASA